MTTPATMRYSVIAMPRSSRRHWASLFARLRSVRDRANERFFSLVFGSRWFVALMFFANILRLCSASLLFQFPRNGNLHQALLSLLVSEFQNQNIRPACGALLVQGGNVNPIIGANGVRVYFDTNSITGGHNIKQIQWIRPVLLDPQHAHLRLWAG